MARSQSLPHRCVVQAAALLLAADGEANAAIARACSTTPDTAFEEKLVDVVGLYLDPPERAVVCSFDEKTQCQALDRTQPSLLMKPGLDALTEAIDVWVSHRNDDPKPFVWTKTANDIIAKAKRGRAALTRQTKSSTHH